MTAEHGNRRILVIDDNQAIHEDFRKILCSEAGARKSLENVEAVLFGDESGEGDTSRFEIDSAYQGQEGLERVKQALTDGRPYALAFIDVRMPPGVDGVETTRQIWEFCPELQVVLCTAY